ncbi:MAG: acyl-ACP--UDP-N-acetylglucosamine O-acyltransferase [Candidatus Omnitrophota bacterium]|nr:MAG: acyl-ACP--UDP-N-acetylglucosamine O-acyltransferase [Candidatus Omnitrophota bacterium]
MKNIHPTALVSKKAKLHEGVEVGPYVIIEDKVSIGPGTRIGPHCVIKAGVSIGKNCQIFSGAVIGSQPQDLKYKGAKSSLVIGDYNIIREYCTFNPGTDEGGRTEIGHHNLFMAYAHVAHDCKIGNHCVLANCGTLAGHVVIEDNAIVSGLTAVHQFVRVGRLAIIGGCSKVVQDIPPFSTCDGHPARVYGLNLVGLKRNAINSSAVRQLGRAFKILFHSQLTRKSALKIIVKELKPLAPEVTYLVDFISSSKRGIVRSCCS